MTGLTLAALFMGICSTNPTLDCEKVTVNFKSLPEGFNAITQRYPDGSTAVYINRELRFAPARRIRGLLVHEIAHLIHLKLEGSAFNLKDAHGETYRRICKQLAERHHLGRDTNCVRRK